MRAQRQRCIKACQKRLARVSRARHTFVREVEGPSLITRGNVKGYGNRSHIRVDDEEGLALPHDD